MSDPDAPPATRVADAPTTWESPRYTLTVRDPDGAEREVEGGADPLQVGSHPKNDVVLEDETVSRLHLRLEPDAHGLCLTDLESTNGTFVDGYRVGRVHLRNGSVIRVGDCELEVRFGDSPDVRPLPSAVSFGPLVGGSTAMRRLYARLEAAARAALPVLLEGETGSGKELAARALHAASDRAAGPFVVFDCAAVSPTLLESVFFGHERGAFTGANERHVGVAEEAEGGTLFLDEMGELPLELQAKLLRVLENRTFRRVGGRETLELDARIVAATNRDLSVGVNRGTFRADLYYRLAVVRLVVPPLRERREDVGLLVERFAREAAGDPRRAATLLDAMSDDDWTRLERHPWPGNVRELRNVVYRMVAMGDPPLEEVPARGTDDGGGERVLPVPRLDAPFLDQKRAIVEAFERWYLGRLIEQTDGNVSAAARLAGIDRMYFKRLLKRHEG